MSGDLTTMEALTLPEPEVSNGSMRNGNGNIDSVNGVLPNQPNIITVDTTTIPIPRTRISLARNSTSEKVTYTWTNINVTTGSDVKVKSETKWKIPFLGDKKVATRKQILHNVTGTLCPGELVAVLGSSGAGKSTLMDVLAFRNSHKLKVSGVRAINGIPVESNTITSISAYVQQMDLFIGVLTVREHLVFQAQVRMHQHIPYKDRLEIVEEVIQEFGLSKCANTKIGTKWFKGLSGGEQKRLSIASEVLTDPMFMCCDEPTSGLDSNTAQQVISILKKLASKQKTIICTIHQPSSQIFALFDKILLMAEGRVAYLGTSADAVQFFSKLGYTCPPMFNPADFLIDILAIKAGNEEDSRETVTKICHAFYDTQVALIAKPVEGAGLISFGKQKKYSPYKASSWVQFKALMGRSWISFSRDPMVFRMRVIQTVFLALFIGGIFSNLKLDTFDGVQNLNGAMFMILCSLTYQHMLAALDTFCSELPVFFREHFNGMYRTDIYYGCKMLIEIPFYILLPLLFAVISYPMMGFDPNLESFAKTVLIMVFITAICSGLGCFLSCLAKDITVALLLAPAIIFPFFLFSGFLLRPGTGPWYLIWLEDLSWYFYGYESMAIVQLERVKGIKCYVLHGLCPSTGLEVLDSLGFNRNNFNTDIMALALMAIASQIIAYLSLLARTIRK